MKKQISSAVIKAVTWSKDSHGLFDYESENVSKRNLKAISNAKIVRTKNDIQLITDYFSEKILSNNSKTLAYLKYQDGTFAISKTETGNNNETTDSNENLWLVVKSIKQKDGSYGYELKLNDIIKLGRVKYRVRDIRSLKKNEESHDISSILPNQDEEDPSDVENIDYITTYKIKQIEESPDLTCRICLHHENTDENPLVSPCACSGSVKYIHLNCLKYWMNSKSVTKTYGTCLAYVWKNIECELCHKQFPEVFIQKDQIINLVDIPKPSPPYLVLESLNKEKQTSKIFYVVTMDTKNIVKMGRGHECDVRINDISVSRLHAFIRLSRGKFYLEDNSSKFGTVALIKNNFALDPNYEASIQIGRSVLTFSLKTRTFPVAPKPINEPRAINIVHNDTFDPNFGEIQFSIKKKEHQYIKPKPSSSFMIDEESESPRMTASTEDNDSGTNSSVFNLTVKKDNNDFSHLKDFIERNIHKNNPKSLYPKEKPREKKNILNEMENLNIYDQE